MCIIQHDFDEIRTKFKTIPFAYNRWTIRNLTSKVVP